MSKKELLLLIWCLEKLSSELGTCGCSDWYFPKDWTPDEKAEFSRQYNEMTGTPEDHDPKNPSIPDFAVADLLAHKVGKLIEQMDQTK